MTSNSNLLPRQTPVRTRSGIFWAGLCIAVSGLYMINPTAGLLELIPDNLPVIGNLDEVAAAALFFSGLRYFGIDPMALVERRGRVDLRDDDG